MLAPGSDEPGVADQLGGPRCPDVQPPQWFRLGGLEPALQLVGEHQVRRLRLAMGGDPFVAAPLPLQVVGVDLGLMVWAMLATTTTREPSTGSRLFSSNPVSAKWPRWFVPNFAIRTRPRWSAWAVHHPALLINRSMRGRRRPARRRPRAPSPAAKVQPVDRHVGGRCRRRICAAAVSPLAVSRTASPPWPRAGPARGGVEAQPCVGAGDDRDASALIRGRLPRSTCALTGQTIRHEGKPCPRRRAKRGKPCHELAPPGRLLSQHGYRWGALRHRWRAGDLLAAHPAPPTRLRVLADNRIAAAYLTNTTTRTCGRSRR